MRFKKHIPKLAHLMPSLAVLFGMTIMELGAGTFELPMSAMPEGVRVATLCATLSWMYCMWYLPDVSSNSRKLDEIDIKLDRITREQARVERALLNDRQT